MKRRDQRVIAANLRDTSSRMVLNRVCIINFHDQSGQVFNGTFMTEETREFYFHLAKTVVNGKLNGKLYETKFADGEISENPAHELLQSCSSGCLTDPDVLDFYEMYPTKESDDMRAAIICSFTYSAPCKDDLGLMDGENLDYNFIVCTICKLISSYGSFFIDTASDGNVQPVKIDRVHIMPKPLEGFVYPAFHDGFPDVNHMMIFTKKPDDDVLNMFCEMFGTETVLSCKSQRESFDCIIRDIFKENLTYTAYANIISALDALRTNYDPAEDDAEITKEWIHEVASRLLGKSCPSYEEICDMFDAYTGNMKIYVSGVFSKDIKISGDGITVKADSSHVASIGIGKCTDGFQLSAYTGEEVSVGDTKIYG